MAPSNGDNLMRSFIGVRKILPITAALLAACSNSYKADAPSALTPAGREFSDEEKRAARSLSVSAGTLKNSETPETAALSCALAISTLESIMGPSLISQEQGQALRRFKEIYQRRASTNLTPGEVARLSKDMEAEYPTDGERARIAIGCLRDLT